MWAKEKRSRNRDILITKIGRILLNPDKSKYFNPIMLQENRQLKKEIQLNCSKCQTIYQLLETQQGNNDNCADNCLKKWQQILTDYHSKELMADLARQENNENEQ